MTNRKNKYYSPKKILSYNADYNLIIGERSNGKTYSVLKHCLEEYFNTDKKFVYIRRYKEDIIGKRGDAVFSALVQNGEVRKITNNTYSHIILQAGKFYLASYDEKLDRLIPANDYFCNILSLSDMEHDKSLSFPNVKYIVYDEFLTRRYYLKDEFMLFMNVLSTIIRDRKDIKIFMLGNTVNRYSPYFQEFGINADKLEQGKISLYHYGMSELTLAVEYCGEGVESKKDSNKYFAFNNPRLNMIKSGAWELDIYPHLPADYSIKKENILYTFYVEFYERVLAGDFVQVGSDVFIYFHEKTTPIKDKNNVLIYSLNNSVNLNVRRNLLRGVGRLEKNVNLLFSMNKVFYQSNEIGEIIHNYNLIACN